MGDLVLLGTLNKFMVGRELPVWTERCQPGDTLDESISYRETKIELSIGDVQRLPRAA